MTVVILAGCVAAFATLIGLVLLTDRPDNLERTPEASKRRHPSSRVPTHVRPVNPPPFDQDKD